MKRFLIVMFIASLLAVSGYAPTVAQDDTKTYTSEDGTTTVTIPADWSAAEVEGFISVVNEPEFPTDSEAPIFTSPEAGQLAAIIILPEDLLDFGSATDAPSADVVSTVLGVFGIDVPNVDTVEVDGVTVSYTSESDFSGAETYVAAIETDLGTISIVGRPNEVEGYQDALAQILVSIEYSGPVEPEPVEISSLSTITFNNASQLGYANQFDATAPYQVRRYAVSPNGEQLALVSQDYDTNDVILELIDIVTGARTTPIAIDGADEITYLDDDQLVIYTRLADEDNTTLGSSLTYFDVTSQSVLNTIEFETTGGFVGGANSTYLLLLDSGSMALYSLDGELVAESTSEQSISFSEVVGYLADQNAIAYTADGFIRGMSLEDGSVSDLYEQEHIESGTFADLSADGRYFIIGGNIAITFVEIETGNVVLSPPLGGDIFVNAVATSADSSLMVVNYYDANNNSRLRILDPLASIASGEIDSPSSDISNVIFSPTNNFILVEDYFSVYVLGVSAE